MEKQYDPKGIENKWHDAWTENKLFVADEKTTKPVYSVVIPPPNVTGILHMGHALNNTVQDIIVRHKRMSGCEVLWVVGTDHAGIATQNVVERQLAKEKLTRHDLGREKFVERVWEWKTQYHATITSQLKRLGTSVDWSRERFTMDEGLSAAVRKVFVSLYNDDLIYRGKYIINWCPRCRTALSDEEAEHKDSKGKLYHFKYPLADGSGHVTVATTRPETMLGDTAVAVNPTDDRYRYLIGSHIMLPLVNRKIPIIADDFVDKSFGTGAVKVTPAHDPNDYAIAQRHYLKPIIIMDEGATMTGPIPDKYKGLDRFACRKEIVADLTALGLVDTIEDHDHAVGQCYRCSTVVEPYYSDQWFVKMAPLAAKALAAAKKNTITFYPERYKKTYTDWMENIRDWCISRQIWWGHRIPVWYCDECKAVIVSETDPTICTHCDSTKLRQDNDVLDTWFSSWLWPFSTMGWPQHTDLYKKFYPTTSLTTAPEILFFWVARMLMAGIYCTKQLPFTDIVLHGTVRDKSGRKMSKSLGNSIDPLDVINVNGADALRFSLMMTTAQGADVYLSPDTFEIGRNFCNKLWNAARFVLGTIPEKVTITALPPVFRLDGADIWMLSRLSKTIAAVESALQTYRHNEAARLLYDCTWHDFCDWYVELKKADLYQTEDAEKQADARALCIHVLGTLQKMLHPFMPFIIEEIWSHLREKITYNNLIDAQFISCASFPKSNKDQINDAIEAEFTLVQNVITAIRTMRAENNIPPDKKGTAKIVTATPSDLASLTAHKARIEHFAKLTSATIGADLVRPSFCASSIVAGNQVFLELEGLIDKQVELERLAKEIARTQSLIESTQKRLESPAFTGKAPAEVVAKEEEKLCGLKSNLEKLNQSLAALH